MQGMLIRYALDQYPNEYIPTVFDNYEKDVEFQDQKIKVGLCKF